MTRTALVRKTTERACERCGCTEFNACVDAGGMACAWVARDVDLCSACCSQDELRRNMLAARPAETPAF